MAQVKEKIFLVIVFFGLGISTCWFYHKRHTLLLNPIHQDQTPPYYLAEDTLHFIIDNKNLTQLKARQHLATILLNGHRVVDSENEKFQLKLNGKKWKAWIKGGTPPHFIGENMPSLNIKSKDEKWGVARFRARFEMLEEVTKAIVKDIGLITNPSTLVHSTLNDEYQGLYWKEPELNKSLEEKGLSGYLIKFDIDYLWTRHGYNKNFREAERGIHYDDPFFHCHRKLNKIGTAEELNTPSLEWIVDHLASSDIGKLLFLIDLLGNDHCSMINNLDFFYDQGMDSIRLIPKDFQLYYNGKPKKLFSNRLCILEGISQFDKARNWPEILGKKDFVFANYIKTQKKFDLEKTWRKIENQSNFPPFLKSKTDLKKILQANVNLIKGTISQKPIIFHFEEKGRHFFGNYTHIDFQLKSSNQNLVIPGLKNGEEVEFISIEQEDFTEIEIINTLTNERFPLEFVLDISKDLF